MKVILTRDVKDTGRTHDVVDVRDGHALNFLIPKGYALAATPSNMKTAVVRAKSHAESRAKETAGIMAKAAALKDAPVVIKKKVNEKGHLYDAVDLAEIAAASGIPQHALTLEKPIKEAGTYEIAVTAGEESAAISVTVEAE